MADSADDAASQRRSGRVVRPPTKYLSEAGPLAAAKRKRDGQGEDGDGFGAADDDGADLDAVDYDDEDEDEDADDDGDDGDDPADGDAGPQRARRPRRKANGSAATKRAIKKPKLNGTSGDSNNNHAASLPSRPKKSVRVTIETDDHGSQLYGEWGETEEGKVGGGDTEERMGRLADLQATSSRPATIATTWPRGGTSATRPTTRPQWPTWSTASCRRPVATTM